MNAETTEGGRFTTHLVRFGSPEAPPARPAIFHPLLLWFSWYSRRLLARSFHRVRISADGKPPNVPRETPLVVYLNHASWWDPLVALFLSRCYFSDRRNYGPIDSASLARYRFFARLGFFGIDKDSPRGAAQFLRTAGEICSGPRSALWVTPQGRFCDPRERPPQIRGGLGHLAARVAGVVFVPLAIEYPFWEDRRPEALIRFGTASLIDDRDAKPCELTSLFQRTLADTQDELARLAVERSETRFETILP